MWFFYCSLFLGTAILLYFMYKNDYQRIERYYFKNDRKLFYVLRACHFVLIVSIVWIIRTLVYRYAKQALENYKKNKSI